MCTKASLRTFTGMFALVDCNNFYASCERVFKPQLNGKPVAILSNNDGCVISRSDEAKNLGLPMGAPAFKYQDFFKQHNVHVFSSNYPLYGDMSNRVMTLLTRFTPDIEVYSIDEAFLKFTGFTNIDYVAYGTEIKNRVYKCTGIPISIGIAPTKALAKVANKIAKKYNNITNGVYVIDSEEKRIKALKWITIQDIWGIGYGHSKRLEKQHVKTGLDFVNLPDQWVKSNMAITGLRLKKELQGINTLDLEFPKTKKAIATTRSFEYTYSDLDNIKERIATFAASCAEKLRKQHSCCNMIIVFLRSDKHKKNAPQHNKSLAITLPHPTNSSIMLVKYAVQAVTQIYKPAIAYKKAGVIVCGLTPANNRQLSLFALEDGKHSNLMKAIDFINRKTGEHKVKIASQDLTRTWKMRQEHLSPRYTTNINDIIVVK